MKRNITNYQYKERDGKQCPNCGQWNTEKQNDLSLLGETLVLRTVECKDCGARWEEEYSLSGYEYL